MLYKKGIRKIPYALFFVRAERLELSHLAALDPKSSASTNSATPAQYFQKYRMQRYLFYLKTTRFSTFYYTFLFLFFLSYKMN